jgi:hypothetical protein
VRLRLLERVGRAIGFSPEGREVRVWVKGMPGADETEVVPGRLVSVREDGSAVLSVRPSDSAAERRLLAVPHEPGWGMRALWFSFISVDVFELRDDGNDGQPGEHVALWFIRLGSG